MYFIPLNYQYRVLWPRVSWFQYTSIFSSSCRTFSTNIQDFAIHGYSCIIIANSVCFYVITAQCYEWEKHNLRKQVLDQNLAKTEHCVLCERPHVFARFVSCARHTQVHVKNDVWYRSLRISLNFLLIFEVLKQRIYCLRLKYG